MLKILDHIEEWLITFLMGVATIIIFVSVVHRYGSGLAIPGLQDWLLSLHFGWAQELCIIMFVWMAKFGAAYGVRTGIHVGVDVLINRLSASNRARFVVIGLGAGALFTGIVGTLGLTFVLENGAHYQFLTWFGMDTGDLYEGPTTPDLEWPTWIVYSAIPLGSYLMCFRFLQVMAAFLRTGELPTHDHGHVEGIDEEHLPVDANFYDMDDNLHPHDLTHKQLGENGKKGGNRARGDKQ
ncbi:TRAP transporter small permease [Aromatoleum aromaticum]|uniref:TRAP transporter small permease protein n=1 Tax=Aromatoleum aromaticum (strain DSM 19018 / LMG 30748 / EbN1) TaxID=76114 RepID=Q5P2I4_AROAE|nr:TRAP transporter small permease [Aromatoleum aromaticum]NMG55688.1 TRAP transporter small permease subunit [Aromatoleum aromaticum]CAI08480.1 C4-dicarboxylate transport system,permease small subunit [Aromatoleum aromaticum EbN1]